MNRIVRTAERPIRRMNDPCGRPVDLGWSDHERHQSHEHRTEQDHPAAQVADETASPGPPAGMHCARLPAPRTCFQRPLQHGLLVAEDPLLGLVRELRL
jgi:hypothetical protein